jgi:penicillin amidase
MRKWIIRLFILTMIIYFIFLAAGGFMYYRSRSPMEGKMLLKGLQGKVTIRRDAYGIPHITADKSDLDAFFALGYVHAQDRFWQMEFNRRVAQGTLSEVLGEKTVTADEYLRTWGLYRAAEKAWPAFSPQTRQILQSYADGVNAYIDQKHLPLQFTLLRYQPRPWTVIDSIAWQKVMAWDLQNVWKAKVKNYLVEQKLGKDQISVLFPPYPDEGPVVLSDEDLKQSGLLSRSKPLRSFANAPDKGSNAWVVSGKLTATGKPLLATDPHLELQSPSLWYIAELKGPHIHVEGATTPGIPAVVLGHNDNIAWGATNVNPDVQDLYILSARTPLKTSSEIIKVRNEKDIAYAVAESAVGPVISPVTEAGIIAPRVALRWTALDANDTTVQSILEINYAKNWTQFVDALKDFVTPSQNFVYADRQGNIGYYLPGKIPLRNWDDILPVQNDAQHQWQGYIPFEKLPHVFNPPSGAIVTANNKVTSDHYPYAVNFRWSVPPYRAERIQSLLNEKRPYTVQQFEEIQLDTVSTLWQSLASELLKTHPLDEHSKLALRYLNAWDGNTGLESVPPTIFAYWYRELGGLTPAFILNSMEWPEPLYIQAEIKSHPDYLSLSLQKAMQKLIQERGADSKKWSWGSLHHAVFDELGLGSVQGMNYLWNREIPAAGGLYTVNAGTYNMDTFRQKNGAGYRQIIDLSDLDNSRYIQSLGQSNNPWSKNYQDMMKLWAAGKYVSLHNQENDAGASKILTLLPVNK